jgi:hypothetical protein
MTDVPPTDTVTKTREFAENANSLLSGVYDDSDYAPQYQKGYKQENVDADATASSFFDGASNKSESGNVRRFAGSTLGTEWNRNQGPIRDLNGLIWVNGKLVESEDEADDAFEEAVDRDERERERRLELERQQWSQSLHSYAGVEMTGEEWGKLADALGKDTPLRRWLVDQIKAKGNRTDAEAQKIADQVALLHRMQSLPKSQWTDEMRALDEELKRNPEKKAELDGYVKQVAEQRNHAFGASNQVEQAASAGAQDLSIGARLDVLDTVMSGEPLSQDTLSTTRTTSVAAHTDALNSSFPTAPDLQENYQAALAATEPLEAPAAPTRVAAISPPTPPPGGGFDV